MKKLILGVITLLIPIFSFTSPNDLKGLEKSFDNEYKKAQEKLKYKKPIISTAKSVEYLDTVLYVDSKGKFARTSAHLSYSGKGARHGVGQIFKNKDTITLTGVSAFALLDLNRSAGDLPSRQYGLKITNVDKVTKLPTTTLDSFDMTVIDAGGVFQVFNFPRSVQVTDYFCVIFEIDTNRKAESFYIAKNRALDGKEEALFVAKEFGVWGNYFKEAEIKVVKDFFDYDLYIRPIISQKITASIKNTGTACQNRKYKFVNTSTFDTLKMMNRIDTTGGNNSYYEWAFGDGNFSKDTEPEYTYSQTGMYNTSLLIKVRAWSRNVVYTDIDRFTLTVNPTYERDKIVSICYGDSLMIGGKWRKITGTYKDTFKTVSNCDSIIKTYMTVLPQKSTILNISICQGESILINNVNRTTSGVYRDTLKTAMNCDSILIYNLKVFPVKSTALNISICQGESILINSVNRTTSGVYRDTLKTAMNCDSILIYTLTVNPIYNASRMDSICQGDSINIGGFWRKVKGDYKVSLKSKFGCDSIVIVNLKVNPSSFTRNTRYICPNSSVTIRGKTRSMAGVYRDTIKNRYKCNVIFETTIIVGDENAKVKSTFSTYAATKTSKVMFSNFSENANSYLWKFGDGNTSIEDNPSHTYATNSKFYKPCLIAYQHDANGILCKSDTTCLEVLSDGAIDKKFSKIAVYPIPTGTLLNIDNIPLDCKSCQIRMFNILGEKVLERTVTGISEKINIPTEVSTGIYIVTIFDRNNFGKEGYSFYKTIEIIK